MDDIQETLDHIAKIANDKLQKEGYLSGTEVCNMINDEFKLSTNDKPYIGEES